MVHQVTKGDAQKVMPDSLHCWLKLVRKIAHYKVYESVHIMLEAVLLVGWTE